MQLTASNQNLGPINSAQLVGVFKAIAPRSFEKTFDGVATAQINTAMKICIDGLTHDQVNYGLSQVRDNGFCPDPAMFRKWCLGITGFGTEQQRLQDSFKGKHAALANVIKFAANDNQPITNAEKEAYNRCYKMFNAIEWAKNTDRAMYLAYEAFKDNYVDVVQEFSLSGEAQIIWVQPDAIEDTKDLFRPMPRLDITNHSTEQKTWVESRIKELQDSGLSLPKSMLQAYSEVRDQRLGGGV